MLNQNCIITVATEGLDPDNNNLDDNKATKKWLRDHPEKRLKSESEIEALKNHLLAYRQGLTSNEKDQSVKENVNLDSLPLRKSDLNKKSDT